MKRSIILYILVGYFCLFFAGCHTVDTLARVKTGNVGFGDFWDAVIADDRDFQENFW